MLGWVAGRLVGWFLVGSVCVDDCWAGRLLRGWFADRLAAVAGYMVGLAVESAVDSPWIRSGFAVDSLWIRCGFAVDSAVVYHYEGRGFTTWNTLKEGILSDFQHRNLT